jgi:hypothetical protein
LIPTSIPLLKFTSPLRLSELAILKLFCVPMLFVDQDPVDEAGRDASDESPKKGK